MREEPAAEEEGGDCPDCVPTCTTEDVPPPGDLCPVGCAGCTAEGATARFYGVFGGLVAFTCLICFVAPSGPGVEVLVPCWELSATPLAPVMILCRYGGFQPRSSSSRLKRL